MSHVSFKEQLQAAASQLSGKPVSTERSAEKSTSNRPKPQSKPQQSKPQWLEHALYGVELLKAHFPGCFKENAELMPLKIGIKQDLVKHLSTLKEIVTEDKACMVKSLAYYVNTVAYHKKVTDGAVRIDLHGSPAGTVSKEEAAYSQQRCEAKLKNRQAGKQPVTEREPEEA